MKIPSFGKIGVLFLLPLTLTLIISSSAVASPLNNAVIFIIRHAEKPDKGYGLSDEGNKRANAYVKYFNNYSIDSRPVRPDYLFSAADSKRSHRARLTLEPLSEALGIGIDSRFQDKQYRKLVHEIKNKSHGKHILICWHRGGIPALLSALGADPKQLLPKAKWPSNVYCWVIQLRFDENSRLIDSKRINEDLMSGDMEIVASN